MNNPVSLEFTELESGRKLSLQLFSKFTCINGKDSGEGKTELLTTLEQGIAVGEIACNLGDRFAIADGGSIGALLSSEHRLVIMSDESTLLRQDLVKKIQNSKHIFVCITRSMLLRMDYPMEGIYEVVRTANDWFEFKQAKSLPLVKDSTQIEKAELIITESKASRSEHEFLQEYFTNLKPAEGRDRIERLLRQCGSTVVFADLSGIGRAYRLLQKRCRQNHGILFYPYQSFEQLLFESHLVQNLPGATELRHDVVGERLFDFQTIEQYYEYVLESITLGTGLEYRHGAQLAKAFKDKTNLEQVLNNPVGSLLLWAIKYKELQRADSF